MAYNPDQNGDYVHGEPGFISQWDMAAEQKMMYLQAASRVQPETAQSYTTDFPVIPSFGGSKIIINPGGNLFAYQFSEAWMDFRSYLDPDGLDWFANTQLAALANRQFCLENRSQYRTYHENSWGLSAGDSPKGYAVFGSSPSLQNPHHNGTVSIYAALACLPFLPDLTRSWLIIFTITNPKPGENMVFMMPTTWMSPRHGTACHLWHRQGVFHDHD